MATAGGYFSPLSQQYGGWKPPQGQPTGGQAPSAPPAPPNPAAPAQGTSTFAQMRQQGVARPPAPAYRPQTQQAPATSVAPPGTQPAPSPSPTPPPQLVGGQPGGPTGYGNGNWTYNSGAGLPGQGGGWTNGSMFMPGTTGPNGQQAPGSTAPSTSAAAQGSGSPGISTQEQSMLPFNQNTGIGQILGYPTSQSTGGSTAVGPGAGAPGGSYGNFAPNTTVNNSGSGPTGTPGQTYGANPFASGQYGAAPATSATQQQTANGLGQSLQNLLGYNIQNPTGGASTSFGSSPLTQGASQLAESQLANPNPYNSQNIQTMMSVLNTPIMEQQQQEIANEQSNMAQRGLFDSTLAQGNLQDIYTNTGRQQLSAADTLLQSAANAQQQGVNSAISNAGGLQAQGEGQYQTGVNNALNNLLGYNTQQFNQQLGTSQQNLAQYQAQLQDALQLLGAT